MSIKKKNKNIMAYAVMLVSTTILAFNNTGQLITLIDLPFSRNTQYWVAGLSFIVGAVWTLYLEKVLK
jgi:hypothetical protein